MSEEQAEYFVKGDTDGEYVAAELPSFRDSIPEEIRENEVFKDMADVGSLAQAYLDANGKLVEAGNNAPQIPESPDGYSIELPDGHGYSDEEIKQFNEYAHGAGLTNDQAAGINTSLGKFGYIAFKEEPFKEKEKEFIEQLESGFDDQKKTPSQRLRAVLYKNWEQNKEGYDDFQLYYNFKMEKIIDHYKGKLD